MHFLGHRVSELKWKFSFFLPSSKRMLLPGISSMFMCFVAFWFQFLNFDSTKWSHMEVQHGGRPSCLAMADPKTTLFGLKIYTLRLTASKIGSFSLCFILRRHCQGWNLIFQFLIGHASTQKCHMTCENAWGQIPNDKHGFSKTCLAMLAALGVCLARAAAILAEKWRIKLDIKPPSFPSSRM